MHSPSAFDRINLGLHMSPPNQTAPQFETGVWAERNGFDSLYLPDGMGRMDAFTMGAGLAPQTSTIRLCLGIVPVFTRPAAVIATSAMTLSHLAPDRFVLGLGASSHTMVDRWYGTPFERPLTRVRETTQLVKSILAGERTNFDGRTIRSHSFRLGIQPQGNIPIHLAALKPKMLELAGEMADGVILNLVPLELVPQMLEHIDTGAKRSGRRVEDLDVAVYLYAFATDAIETAEREMANIAAGYFSTPVYNNFLDWMGYPVEAKQIIDGFAERDRNKTLNAFSSEVLHKLGIIGSAEECRSRIVEYANAGITTPVIAAAAADPGIYRSTLDALARPARDS
ncbi:MAG: LLM class flavin-dependent oxidoreductase [Pseudomonadota bacterium]